VCVTKKEKKQRQEGNLTTVNALYDVHRLHQASVQVRRLLPGTSYYLAFALVTLLTSKKRLETRLQDIRKLSVIEKQTAHNLPNGCVASNRLLCCYMNRILYCIVLYLQQTWYSHRASTRSVGNQLTQGK